MLKAAYHSGIQTAFVDLGLTKIGAALPPGILTRFVRRIRDISPVNKKILTAAGLVPLGVGLAVGNQRLKEHIYDTING